MKKDISFQIEEDVIEKFQLAVQLAGTTQDTVIEDQMKEYIASSFSKIAIEYGASKKFFSSDESQKEEWTGKALKKIPMWANKQTQIPYRIIRAFLQLEQEEERVAFDQLKDRCSDDMNYPDTYVRKFDANFAQLKLDSAKSHGKIFEIQEEGERQYVKIWLDVEEKVRDNSDKFLELHPIDKGYINTSKQKNMGASGRKGTDHGQKFYHMVCTKCGYEYEANGSDIFLKKCPKCQGGIDSGRK